MSERAERNGLDKAGCFDVSWEDKWVAIGCIGTGNDDFVGWKYGAWKSKTTGTEQIALISRDDGSCLQIVSRG